MSGIVIAVIAVAAVAISFLSIKAEASMSANESQSLDDIFRKYGEQRGIDWQLLKAIAMHESSLDPSAVNASDNESIGLMQVLCRPDGKGGCANRPDAGGQHDAEVDGWSEVTRDKLLEPDFNVRVASDILRQNIQAYGLPRGIALYNRFGARLEMQGGPFKNQSYVDAVVNNYKELTA